MHNKWFKVTPGGALYPGVISMNKQKIPFKVYLELTVGFFFCLIIIWYFSYRLLFPLLAQTNSASLIVGIPALISFIICLMLVKPSLKKEMERLDEPFTVVARNPDIEIKKEPLTIKGIIIRIFVTIIISIIVTIPFTIISVLKFSQKEQKSVGVFFDILGDYKGFYIFFMILSLVIVFVIFPGLKKWHWTKHQFR